MQTLPTGIGQTKEEPHHHSIVHLYFFYKSIPGMLLYARNITVLEVGVPLKLDLVQMWGVLIHSLTFPLTKSSVMYVCRNTWYNILMFTTCFFVCSLIHSSHINIQKSLLFVESGESDETGAAFWLKSLKGEINSKNHLTHVCIWSIENRRLGKIFVITKAMILYNIQF